MCASESHREGYLIRPAAQDADPTCAATAKLCSSGYPHLRSVCCDCYEGVLWLSGTVPSFYMKQMAQELVSQTPGVSAVRNQLLVTSFDRRAGTSVAG